MVDITFEAFGSPVECVNIGIERDLLVEDTETFSFVISPTQDDPAVQVGAMDRSSVIITDEEDGMYNSL